MYRPVSAVLFAFTVLLAGCSTLDTPPSATDEVEVISYEVVVIKDEVLDTTIPEYDASLEELAPCYACIAKEWIPPHTYTERHTRVVAEIIGTMSAAACGAITKSWWVAGVCKIAVTEVWYTTQTARGYWVCTRWYRATDEGCFMTPPTAGTNPRQYALA